MAIAAYQVTTTLRKQEATARTARLTATFLRGSDGGEVVRNGDYLVTR